MRKARPSKASRHAPRTTLTILNRQRVRCVDSRLLRRITRSLIEDLLNCVDCELGLQLVGAAEMAHVNKTFLQHSGSTDVITFDHTDLGMPGRRTSNPRPQPPLHGELFICLDDAVGQARAFRTTWQSEIVRYIVHGVLHLRGFDDRTARARQRMKREENRLLRELSQRFDLAKL